MLAQSVKSHQYRLQEGSSWFSPLLREVFLRVLRFSPLLKNQHFKIPIRSGTHGHVSTSSYELLSAPWVNKLQYNYKLRKFLQAPCGLAVFKIVLRLLPEYLMQDVVPCRNQFIILLLVMSRYFVTVDKFIKCKINQTGETFPCQRHEFWLANGANFGLSEVILKAILGGCKD